ncbi:hypothetical protein MMC30_008295 [Trapelia coarctata]|nr:hypothetical protein [Trapelia coarctata]
MSNEDFFQQGKTSDDHRQRAGDSQSDESSISSVPSMFSGTTLSSLSSARSKINVATEELVSLLHNDRGLRPLFDTALQRLKPSKFESTFTKLLKTYAVELRHTAADNLEMGAVRLVYSQRKFVANCIRRVYVPDSSDIIEELHQIITQNPAKDQQLEKFFYEMGLVPKALPKVADLEDGQSSDDSDMGDPEQPYLPNLTQVRKFMLSGVAFENLRKNFDRGLNPRDTGESKATTDRKRARSPSIEDIAAENAKRRRGPHPDDTATEAAEPDFRDAALTEEAKTTPNRKRQRSPSFDGLLEPLSKHHQRRKGQHPESSTDAVVESGFENIPGVSAEPVWPSNTPTTVSSALKEVSPAHDRLGNVETKHDRLSDLAFEPVGPPEALHPQATSESTELAELKAQRRRSLSEIQILHDEPESPQSSHKKHKCPNCSKSFTRYHNLKSHLLIHSQKRPYIRVPSSTSISSYHYGSYHGQISPRVEIKPELNTSFSGRISPFTEARVPTPEPTTDSSEKMDTTNRRTSIIGIPYRAVRRYWNIWRRPRLRPGYRRLEWICECGDELYGDFENTNPEAVNNLHMILQNPGLQSPQQPGQPQTASLGSSAASTNQAAANPGINSIRNPRPAPIGSMIPTGCNMPPSPEPYTRKFLELCVNTGKFHKSLGEIDITNINCDRDLFTLTKQRYEEVRGHRSRFFLLEPTAVEWVHFSLEERHSVGILLRPNAVPPKNEVVSKHYEYAPCPLDALPPIPDNIFLHHLTNPGPHRSPVWLRRLPKKVNDSILGLEPRVGNRMGRTYHRRPKLACCMASGVMHRLHERPVWNPLVSLSERCFWRFWRGELDDERFGDFDDGVF